MTVYVMQPKNKWNLSFRSHCEMAQAANVEEVDWACARPKSVIIF